MFWLYFLALIPICSALILKQLNPNINWIEYGIGSLIALLTAGIFNIWAYYGQIGDHETWSGSITQTRQFSAWQEYYEYAVYRTETRRGRRTVTDSKGRSRTESYTYTVRVFDHWEPTKRWHNAYWKMYSNIDTSYDIEYPKYMDLVHKFGGSVPVAGNRQTGEHNSRMIGGDPNDYVAMNNTGYIEPVNKSVYFENRVKASASIFRKRKISDREAKDLFPYPYSTDPYTSNRLLGDANKYVTKLDWEKLNGYLGPIKKINLICIGYPAGTDAEIFDKQVAYWEGGKKNDLIIGFGPGWSRVNSWSDAEMAKSNISTLFLTPTSNTLLEDLKSEVLKNFTKVEWKKKFQHLSIQPRMHHIVWYIAALFVTQIGIYIVFHYVDFTKNLT